MKCPYIESPLRLGEHAKPSNIMGFFTRCHGLTAGLGRVLRVSVSTILVGLSGCATSRIPPAVPPESIFRLASANSAEVQFRVSAPPAGVYGHQFLAVILPFGQILVQRPEADLRAAIFQALAARGYRPVEALSSSPMPSKSLDFSLSELQLSAYDAIVFRIPYCRFSLRVTQTDGAGRELKRAQGEFSDYATRAMAFTPELQPLYYETLAAAAETVIAELSL